MDKRKGRNIVVFSDGTGQRGGIFVDECRSNIYKLYRACRPGPESEIRAAQQLAFYDPGIGTVPKGIGPLGGLWQWVVNLVSRATGLGLTRNIIDCYSDIIRHWRPGDRIFLFGFSRGAYTARCVAAVLVHCGVPQTMADGTALKRDAATCRRIAREAVTKVYQHVSSEKDEAYLGQRRALAARFRARHSSGDENAPNAAPHFIGVFDTVAAVWNKGALALTAFLGLSGLAAFSGVTTLAFWLTHRFGWTPAFGFWPITGVLTLIAIVALVVAYFVSHIKWATDLPGFSTWDTLHLTSYRMEFYDQQLSSRVGWARHALAVDEFRRDFDRVPWGDQKDVRATAAGEPEWLKQVWFAGCHSDVGGSYPDSESGLSDIALDWMAREAAAIPDGLLVDAAQLKLDPDPLALQHDETRGLAFRYAERHLRGIPNDAPLHPSVIDRFSGQAVQHFDVDRAYRPEPLRGHDDVKHLYPAPTTGAP